MNKRQRPRTLPFLFPRCFLLPPDFLIPATPTYLETKLYPMEAPTRNTLSVLNCTLF
jgi:hypothetical protein